MDIFLQLMYLMLFSLAGDSISRALHLPIPGSVIGMIMLFLALKFRFLKLEKVEKVSNFLVNNLPILFVAAGVGIMTKFGLIAPIWVSFFSICIFTTVVSLAVISKVVKYIKDKYEGDKNA